MAQPWSNALNIAMSAVQAAMTEYWDPRILQESQRLSDLVRIWNPKTKPWPAGNTKVHVRVQNQLLRATRAHGDLGVANASASALPQPQQTEAWTEWQIRQEDLMSYLCPVRYRFKLNQLLGAKHIGPIAQRLSKESIADVVERIEIALLTNQNGELAQVVHVSDEFKGYSDTHTNTSTHGRIWFNGSPAIFQPGDVLDLVSVEGSYFYGAPQTTAFSTHLKVTNVGYERGASGVYGYIDYKPSEAGAAGTFHIDTVEGHPSSVYLLFAGERGGSSAFYPGSSPAQPTSDCKNMYGLKDWFIEETGSPGTIYNKTRTSEPWTIPLVYKPSTTRVVQLADIDEVLTQVFQKRLADARLTEYVGLCGVRMAQKLTELTGTANRLIDGSQTKTRLFTNYGFNGSLIRHVGLDSALAIYPVRGMPEDRIYVVQPGVLSLLQPGGVQWIPWHGDGGIWHAESDSSGQRTDVYRADRHVMVNSLIELPRINAAILNIKPD